MSRLAEAKRIVGLLVVLMAAVVVLSGPVAGVLDLPEPTAEAKKKHKKKKKKKQQPFPFNIVQCPTEINEQLGDLCIGTSANDFLVGGPEGNRDLIGGEEGNDFYNGGTGGDTLVDSSATSSDYYLFPATGFGRAIMLDVGGNGDTIGLQSYSIDDFKVTKGDSNSPALLLEGSSGRSIEISNFFDDGEIQGKIETFLFREGYFTGDQVASGATAQQAIAPQEQAVLKERLDEAGLSPSGEPIQQQQEKASS